MGAEGTALTDTVTDGSGDGFVFRVGPGCILGGGVLASLLGVEGAVEWKDEIRNGAPNVGCEAGATAVAATERYGLWGTEVTDMARARVSRGIESTSCLAVRLCCCLFSLL